ncbi:MAG: hypothetical protein ACRC8Z_00935 [Empedobacter falsenii]
MKTTDFLVVNLLKITFLFSFFFCFSCSNENQDMVSSKEKSGTPTENNEKLVSNCLPHCQRSKGSH